MTAGADRLGVSLFEDGSGTLGGTSAEASGYGHDGTVGGKLRPSPCVTDDQGVETCTPYTLYVSRGLEYELR